jgi:hypothetical protein
VVVDFELAPQLGQQVEVLDEGEVFSGITLGLLRYQESEVEVVEAEGIFVQTVYVDEETDVFDCLFSHLFVFFHELGDKGEPVVQCWRRFADVRSDDVLEVGGLASVESLEHGVTDGIDLGYGPGWHRFGFNAELSPGLLGVLVHGFGDILLPIVDWLA